MYILCSGHPMSFTHKNVKLNIATQINNNVKKLMQSFSPSKSNSRSCTWHNLLLQISTSSELDTTNSDMINCGFWLTVDRSISLSR